MTSVWDIYAPLADVILITLRLCGHVTDKRQTTVARWAVTLGAAGTGGAGGGVR